VAGVDGSVVEWLLAGDPSIRWQVMRDLLDEPAEVWERERRLLTTTGWAADLLARQGADGEWPPGRWTASTWTLLLLVALGLPGEHPAARDSLERLLGRFMPRDKEVDGAFLLKRVDLCHLGFWLGLGAHFLDGDPRLEPLGEAVLSAQLADGGWNCQVRNHPATRHSSFHTTFNVLENLRIAFDRGVVAGGAFRDAEQRAAEFVREHRLYRSDKTGEVISGRFTELTYPWHWHYTVLRGLDYLRLTPALGDERADDALELLAGRRKPNGRWPLQKRIPACCEANLTRCSGCEAEPASQAGPGRGARSGRRTRARALRRRLSPASRARSSPTGSPAAVRAP
jgi:hypothetical protein